MQYFIIDSKFRPPPSTSAEVADKILHNDYKNSGNTDRLNEGATFQMKRKKIVNHHYQVISSLYLHDGNRA
jgi:hypothetical protein